MPPRLSYENVKEELESKGCRLLSGEYKNNRTPITYLCRCGHERTSTLNTFRTLIDYNCFDCVNGGGGKAGHLNNTNKGMHYKTFEHNLRVMERLYSMTHKYRDDFLEENYNRKQKCYICKRDKQLFLFPIGKNYKSNHRTICKHCSKIEHRERRSNHTQEQHIQEILSSSKSSTRRRVDQGRSECSEHTLSKDDIYEILEEQDGKCFYSGRNLVFEYNNINKISIDRIDNNKGYTRDNVKLVCWVVNQAKSNMEHDEFLSLVKDISKVHL